MSEPTDRVAPQGATNQARPAEPVAGAEGPSVLLLSLGPTPLRLTLSRGRPVLRTGKGQVLDHTAATVLIALGGGEPVWLRPLEGLVWLSTACHDFAVVAALAPVVAGVAGGRHGAAADVTDPLLLGALAAAGVASVAAHPCCTVEAWDLLAAHRDVDVRRRAAGYGVLGAGLAHHPDPAVRKKVAANPALAADALDRLGHDRDHWVRVALAANPSTPPATLAGLHKIRRLGVPGFQALARNRSTPPPVLARLMRSVFAEVRAAAAANPNTPARAARHRVFDVHYQVRVGLAPRPDLDVRALRWLERYSRHDSVDQYRTISGRIAANANVASGLAEGMEDRIARAVTAAKAQSAPLASPRPSRRRVVANLLGFLGLFLLPPALSVYGAVIAAQGRLGPGVGLQAAAAAALAAEGIALRQARRPCPGIGWRPPRPTELTVLAVVFGVLGFVGAGNVGVAVGVGWLVGLIQIAILSPNTSPPVGPRPPRRVRRRDRRQIRPLVAAAFVAAALAVGVYFIPSSVIGSGPTTATTVTSRPR